MNFFVSGDSALRLIQYVRERDIFYIVSAQRKADLFLDALKQCAR